MPVLSAGLTRAEQFMSRCPALAAGHKNLLEKSISGYTFSLCNEITYSA
jgi:hypothetical protein